jgi:hypothetical protein
MSKLLRTTGLYTSFSHRLLWDSVQRHLDLAAENPQDSWFLHLSAGLLAAAAFEAYLNYLGGEILPEVWLREKEEFARVPYRGTEGKLLRIAEEIQLVLPKKSDQTYQAFSELKALRDKVVHAKPRVAKHSQVHKANKLPNHPKHWLELEAKQDKVARQIKGLEELAIIVHTAARSSEYQSVVFGAHPFNGALGIGVHTID